MRMSGPKQSGTFYEKRQMAVKKLANRKGRVFGLMDPSKYRPIGVRGRKVK